ncbi:MAG TPA: Arm DNA-binding domain-containing protein, partial [Novosphingobium sp.]
MARRAITKTAVDELPATGRQHFLWDVSPPGFGVRVSPAGVKSYIYQYRIGGRSGQAVRTTIGRHGELTVDQARKLAHKLAEKVREAVDPVKAKRAALQAEREAKAAAKDLAFDAYCKLYLERRVEGEGMASKGNIEMAFRLHATPVLKSKPLPEITKRDISAVLDSLPANSLALRRSVFAILSKMMNWAVVRGDIAASPMLGM